MFRFVWNCHKYRFYKHFSNYPQKLWITLWINLPLQPEIPYFMRVSVKC